MRRLLLLILLILFVFVSGCSNQEENAGDSGEKQSQNKEEDPKEEEQITFPPAPVEVEEIVKQKPGTKVEDAIQLASAGNEDSIPSLEELVADFPKEQTSPEEVFNGIVHWFANDYSEVYEQLVNYDPDFGDFEIAVREQKHENIAFQLDASGSMAGQVKGGVKMDLAKSALQNVASGFQDDTSLSLRVYGHKGSGSDKDKEMSCSSTEILFGPGLYEEASFEKALDSFKPSGWTPLAASIKAAYEDLKGTAEDDSENLVYVISDGVETCGGDPVAEAERLATSDLNIKVNVIGFDVDDEGEEQLRKVAEAGNGVFRTVHSRTELMDTLEEILSDAKSVVETTLSRAKAGIEVNKKSLELKENVGDLRSHFIAIADRERSLFIDALQELYESEAVKDEDREKVMELISKRHQDLVEFSNTLKDEANAKIDEEQQMIFDALDAS